MVELPLWCKTGITRHELDCLCIEKKVANQIHTSYCPICIVVVSFVAMVALMFAVVAGRSMEQYVIFMKVGVVVGMQ